MGRFRHKADWSELYPEILTSIARRLQTHDDFRHFRSVCANWRSLTNQIPNNLPILSPIFPRNFPSHRPPTLYPYGQDRTVHSHFIVANTTFLIQNPNPNFPIPWLVTVEELNPGKLILRKPLVRNTMEEDFPRVLDLSRFRVRKIRKDYNFRNVKGDFLPTKYKLLLFSNYGCCGDPTSVDDCYAFVLDNERKLLFARLKNAASYDYLKYSGISCFDDIVCYKGGVWIIDRKGRAYVIRYDTKHVRLELFAAEGVYRGKAGDMRNRLLESDEGLYLIHRVQRYGERKFSVYKLNEVEHKWCEVKDLDDRILFVFSDFCFFTPAEDFPGCVGNFIINNIFDCAPYSYWAPSGTEQDYNIGVFNLDDGKYVLITSYPGLSEIFWPPPCWLFSNTCPSTSPRQKSDENGPEVCNSVEMCSASLAGETNVQATGSPTNTQEQLPPTWIQLARSSSRDEEENEVEIPTLEAPCASNGVQIGEQVKTKLPAMDAHPIHSDSHASTVQMFNHDPPGNTLKRYNIKSNLKPILEKIWEKHGDITERITLRNTDMVSSALESLATAVLILKKNTGRSLSESQADYLSSSLSDLQHMRFKVGWLVPFVEMALAIKKSRPLVDSLKEFSETKARAQESKMKVLDELAKLDEVEELTFVMEKITVLENVDLEKGLGEGLYLVIISAGF